mgnify:CR=1 FL=1
MQHSDLPMLERIAGPADLKGLKDSELFQLAHECAERLFRPCPKPAGIWAHRWGLSN